MSRGACLIIWIVGIDKLSYNIFVHIDMGLNNYYRIKIWR